MAFDFFSLLSLGGGLAFFLYGMRLMSVSLERMTGGRMERLLKKATANPFVSLLLGIIITAVVQSSSATTVMLIGLVNSGILAFSQAIYVCYGANIGTTVTAWIFSLIGVSDQNPFLRLLKPVNLAPAVALIGIFLLLSKRGEKRQTVGEAAVGFSALMLGMSQMTSAVEPLSELPQFFTLLSNLQNPIFAFLVAMLFTALIQSSSAATGILQALSVSGGFRLGMAAPMVMGINVGTCVTAMLSSIGASVAARRLASSHLLMNLLCSLICLPLLALGNTPTLRPLFETSITPATVALLHTLFNLFLTLLLLPFTRRLINLTEWIVRERNGSATLQNRQYAPDDRLLASPSVAVAECYTRTLQMARLSYRMLRDALDGLEQYDENTAKQILSDEDRLDGMEDQLGTYLLKLSPKALSDTDSRAVSRMLHSIGNHERLGDHATNLLEVAQELSQKEISFSGETRREIQILKRALLEILILTEESFTTENQCYARQVEPLEEVIDRLTEQIKSRQVERLRNHECTVEQGFILSDFLTNCERISDHCSNIAATVMELEEKTLDTHRYLNELRREDRDFQICYQSFRQKYRLQDENEPIGKQSIQKEQ